MPNWDSEREEVNSIFAEMIKTPTADGSKKRQRGEKPSWKIDRSHEAALFSHLSKWKHGEKVDPESGAHPLVHLAWRALAIAYQEGGGQSLCCCNRHNGPEDYVCRACPRHGDLD